MSAISEIAIRELGNRDGTAIDRVADGEVVTITRHGEPAAELRHFNLRRTGIPSRPPS